MAVEGPLSGVRLAYLLGTDRPSDLERAIREGRAPRPEYAVFLERHEAVVFERRHAQRGRTPLGAIGRRAWGSSWDLAESVLNFQPRFDAIVCSGEDLGLPLAVQSIVRRRKPYIFVITHGSYFGSPKLRFLMGLLRHADWVHYLCLSESLRRSLVRRFGVRQDRAHNAGYGVDTVFFRPDSRPSGAPLIVSAGVASRDYTTLITAADNLGLDLHIAIDSTWFPVRTQTSAPDAPPWLRMQSAGNYVGLRDLYAKASIVVVPLRPARHACGYAVMAEAMAMGKAVIVTRTEAPSDFLVEGKTGYSVQPGEVADLRRRIVQLIGSPATALRLGMCGRQRIQAHFSLERYVDRIEYVIAQAMSGLSPHDAINQLN